MTDFIAQEKPFTGRKMLLIMVAFFGVIIAVNGTMMTFALKTFGGLVVDNSYVASQHFNADVAAARAQLIRNWTFDVSNSVDTIRVIVNDQDGSAQSGLALSIEIARPSHERDTIALRLEESAPGMYTGHAPVDPGQWLATIITGDGQKRSLTFLKVEVD